MQFISRLSAASLMLAAPLVFGSSSQHMDAADANASVPSTRYESAFSDYIVRKIDEVSDWKEANSKAGSGGGHAGHNMSHAIPEAPPEQNIPPAGHHH